MKKIWNYGFWNHGNIMVLSLLLFLNILGISVISNRNLSQCVEAEARAQTNRYNLTALGESLADASDYLTDEVRKFAVTGEVEHLYNYWYEVYETRDRDTAIQELTDYAPPMEELAFLEEAKSHSDQLILTETCAMKLKLLGMDVDIQDYQSEETLYSYLSQVMAYQLEEKYENLSQREQEEVAVNILYDGHYNQVKNQIMNPIGAFQTTMNERLNLEVAEAVSGREKASLGQNICLVVALGLLLVFFALINKLYIRPITRYTRELEGVSLTEVRITPTGAFEMSQFGEQFNVLAEELKLELNRRASAEESMRQARDQADRANAAKSDFLACMSHELRTPLNAITGYLYLLKREELSGKQFRYVNSIDYSAENLLGIISNILDFSKIESGKTVYEYREFSPLEMMQEVRAIMVNQAKEKGLELRIQADRNLGEKVIGDDVKIKQILVNLVGNAIKFTQEGGVTLECEKIETIEDGEILEFRVRDTGIGISKKDQKKIFHPFVQSDAQITRKFGGTGLGLTICRRLIEEMSQGEESLQLQSEEGEGSCFSFRMKLPFGDGLEKEDAGEEEVQIADGEQCILLIDDSEINLSVESEIILSYGMKVDTAKSGREGLEKIHNRENDYDMILMDIRMPDMDGYEAAGEIRKVGRYKTVPIIALTADVVTGVKERVKSAGMNYCVEKPLNPQKLYKVIRRYLSIAIARPERIYQEQGLFAAEECLEMMNQNQENMCRLLELFFQEHRHKAEDIYIAIARDDYDLARGLLHDLEGAVGSLCCHDLYQVCKKLHQEIREGKSVSTNEFLDVWKRTMKEVQGYYEAHKERRCLDV